MKKLILAAMIAGLALFSCSRTGAPDQASVQTQVLEVMGVADLIRDNRTERLKPGLTLLGNDRIRTFAGTVDIRIAGLGLCKVKPNSTVELSSVSETARLGLKKGTILVVLNKLKKTSKFEVETPIAVVGVRGTSFIVSASADKVKTGVLTGRVEIDQGGSKAYCDELRQVTGTSEGMNKQSSMDPATSADAKDFLKISGVETMNDYDRIRLNIKKLNVVESGGRTDAVEGMSDGLKAGELSEEGRSGAKRLDGKSGDVQSETGIETGDRKVTDDEFAK